MFELDRLDQAFFDIYCGHIPECDEELVLLFLQMQNSEDPDWDQFPSEYYSHLMDTYIAFMGGVRYQKELQEEIDEKV